MIRTTPQSTWRRKSAKMPATTSTTARIHNRSSMTAGYPRPQGPNVRALTLWMP